MVMMVMMVMMMMMMRWTCQDEMMKYEHQGTDMIIDEEYNEVLNHLWHSLDIMRLVSVLGCVVMLYQTLLMSLRRCWIVVLIMYEMID